MVCVAKGPSPRAGQTMLPPMQFQEWCARLQLPPATCTLIARLRVTPPTRRVQSRAGNVSGRYPSRPSRSNEQIFYGKQESLLAPKEYKMPYQAKKQCVAQDSTGYSPDGA